MPRSASLCLALVLAVAALPRALAQEPVVERDGSRLRIEWYSCADGSWTLTDPQGRTCAGGRVTSGRNVLEFSKVAAPLDLEFRIRVGGPGADVTTFRIPGDKRVSPLRRPNGPSVIYQLPPRTYLAWGTGRAATGQLEALTTERLAELKDLGADYIWLTGVVEHANRDQTDPDVVKGDAGSYYAIYDYWDVSGQIGDLAAFEEVIERAHSVGLRVLIDFVANHTARKHRTDITCKQHLDFGINDDTRQFFSPGNNYFYISGTSFTPPVQPGNGGTDGIFDTDIFTPGIQLETPARVTGNDIISAEPAITDWFETAKLNYGWDIAARFGQYEPRPRTWAQMIDVAKYWLEKGVDGFRVDYAHAVPMEFWREFVREVRSVHPEAFLLAEAYETDYRMKVPGFSYEALLDAGFDSVYNSELYWALHREATHPGNMRAASATRTPAMRDAIVQRGYMLTHYMENHDEVRVASRHFAAFVADRDRRARLGLAYTAYLGLMPSHLLMHGGQELQEDASVFGRYDGDNGKTSIFDFVYQPQTRTWLYGTRPGWMVDFRNQYKKLLALKHTAPFNRPHSASRPTFIDLDGANWHKETSKWIGAYVRFDGNEARLVVTNSDPFQGHVATIHFTGQDYHDQLGALSAMRITNDDSRYVFREIFSREGWVPMDPAVDGEGLPGWALYRSGNIPSGLHLGEIPPGTTYVFRIDRL